MFRNIPFAKLLVSKLALLGSSSSAFAQTAPAAPDFSPLLDNIDFSTINAAILSVGATLVGMTVIWVGARKVLRMIRSA